MKLLKKTLDLLLVKDDLALLIQKKNLKGINRFFRVYGHRKDLIQAAEYLSFNNLHKAIEKQELDVIKCVIDNGFDVNITTPINSVTLLDNAIHNFNKKSANSLKIIKHILDNDFDITKRDLKGHTALHKSIQQKATAVIQLILEKHPNIINDTETVKNSYLDEIIETKHLPTIKEIIKAKPLNEYNFDKYNCSPLYSAISTRNREIIDFLIDEEPEIIKAIGTNGYSSIHIASFCGDEITFNKLLKRHPELINLPNKKEQTPLFLALSYNNNNIVNTIIEKDPALLYKEIGSEKIQPIEIAAKINKEESFKNLMEKIKKYPPPAPKDKNITWKKGERNQVICERVLPCKTLTRKDIFSFKNKINMFTVEGNDQKGDVKKVFNGKSLSVSKQKTITEAFLQAVKLEIEVPNPQKILTMGKK